MGERTVSTINGAGKTGHPHVKESNLTPILHPLAKEWNLTPILHHTKNEIQILEPLLPPCTKKQLKTD